MSQRQTYSLIMGAFAVMIRLRSWFRGILIAGALTTLLAAVAFAAGDEAKRILSLIDYIGGDYKNAVQGGKVISADEYTEMSEFASRSLELFKNLKTADGDIAGIEKDLNALAAHIKSKSGEDIVPLLAQQIKDRLIKTYKIVPYPRQLPAFADGKRVYFENCAACHGESGKGDGPGRQSMNPKTPLPANFTDPERIGGLSPFKVFNTTGFGIEGTAMASFTALSEEQRWQVAFYVMGLRFPAQAAIAGEAWLKGKPMAEDLTSIAALATTSDDDLSAKIKQSFPGAPGNEVLAYLRRGLLERKSADPLLIARTLLSEAAAIYGRGDKEKAYQKAIEAYLEGFEMAEPALFAKDASLGRSLESQFTNFRNSIRQGVSVEEIQRQRAAIDAGLEKVTHILAETSDFSGYYAFVNSALIILREGLEAALILAAIIAMLKVMGATHAVRYIHLGWILALGAGLATWLAAQTILTFSGQHRESMEGFISLFAAAALFYVGYWLHTRSEAKRWHAFIHERVQNVLSSKSVLGLVGISFFAVYREAFEVVLFYQALWLQNENSHSAILAGFGVGVIAMLAAALVIFKLGMRMPLRYFFGVTGTLLYIIAFIFAGTGINQLQAAGWIPATPLSFPPAVPLLGIYPTMETLAAQALLVCGFITSSAWMALARRKALP